MWKKLGYFVGALVVVFVVLLGGMLAWPIPEGQPFDSVAFRPEPGPQEVRPTTTYTARDGHALPLRVYPAEDGGRVLILLHGIAINGDYFHDMASYLSEEGIATVYVPDLRAHGHGSEPVADVDYIGQIEDDVVDLLAHVRQESPGARVFIGGHSAGGGLALRVASSGRLDDVAGYVLLAPGLDRDAPTMREDAGGLLEVSAPRAIALSLLEAAGIEALHGLEVLRMNWPERYHGDHLTVRYTMRFLRSYLPSDHASDFASVDAPLLVVAGDADEIFHGDRYAEVVEAHAPNGEAVTKPGFGHFNDLLANRETFDVVARWIEGN